MELMRPAKLNALASYASFAATTALAIIINPLLVAHLGSAAFGTWKAVQKFLDFSTIADGRATQALKWVVASQQDVADTHEKRQAVGSAAAVWMLFLPLSLVIAGTVAWNLPSLIKDAPFSDVDGLRVVGFVLALNLLLIPLLGIPDAILIGVNRGYISTITQTVVLVLSNIAMVLAAQQGGGLISLAIVVIAATFAKAAIVFLQTRANVRWFGIARPSRRQTGRFFKFSGLVLAWAGVSKILLLSDVLLMSFLIGAGAVTDYTFTSYFPQFGLAVCLMTGSAVMPGIGRLLGAGEITRAGSLVRRSRQVILLVATVIGGLAMAFNDDFVRIWAGQERFMGSGTSALIVLSAFQLSLVRNEAQVQDLTLSIRSKVANGLVYALAGVILGYVGYQMTGEIWTIVAGAIIGRLPLSWKFPKMVNSALATESPPWGKQCVALGILLICYAVGTLTGQLGFFALISLAVAIGLGLVVASLWLLTERSTRVWLFTVALNHIPSWLKLR